MSCQRRALPLSFLALIALLACNNKGLSPTLRLDNFVADPPGVIPGEATTLRWVVGGADTVVVTDDRGAELMNYDAGRRTALGSLVVIPTVDTTYRLTIQQGKDTLSSDAAVRVFPKDVPPTISFFEVTPPVLARGDTTTLRWGVVDAASLAIHSPDGDVFMSSDPATLGAGELDLIPIRSTTYELVVTNPSGEARATASVDVVDLPVVDAFTATPLTVTRGEPITLEWRTQFATSVVVVDAENTPIAHDNVPEEVAMRRVEVPAIFTSPLTLTASSFSGRAQTSLDITVLAPPQITHFGASPTIVASGDPVVLSWDTLDATLITLTDNTPTTLVAAAETSGSITVNPTASRNYTLAAQNAAGSSVQATVTVLVDQAHPTVSAVPNMFSGGSDSEFLAIATVQWDASGATAVTVEPPLPPYTVVPLAAGALGTGSSIVTVSADVPAASVPIGFDFVFGGRAHSNVSVSYYGYLSFASPAYLPTGYSASCFLTPHAIDILAPYWWNPSVDELVNTVRTQLQGVAPNRSLVVQWRTGGGEMMVQAELHENGAVSFHYLQIHSWTGNWDAGVEELDGKQLMLGCRTDTYYSFREFANAKTIRFDPGVLRATLPIAGSKDIFVYGDKTYHFSAIYPTHQARADLALMTVGGGVVINEVMANPKPAVPDSNGEWFEVKSLLPYDVQLQGWVVQSEGIDQHEISSPLLLPANGYLVFGVDASPATNGGVAIDYVYPRTGTLALSDTADMVALVSRNTYLTSLWEGIYDLASPAITGGHSRTLFRNYAAAGSCNSERTACQSSLTYGSAGLFGTPGGPNDDCGVLAGDTCADAVPLDLSSSAATVSVNINTATQDATFPACADLVATADAIGPERFYRIDVPSPSILVASVWDTKAAYYNPEGLLALAAGACDTLTAATCVPSYDPVTATLTGLRRALAPGQYTLAVIAGNQTRCGTLELHAQLLPPDYLVSSTPKSFASIVASGTTYPIDDDTVLGPLSLGFTMPTLAGDVTSVRISVNGVLSLLSTGALSSNNVALTDADAPHGLIAPFWDDLTPAKSGTSQLLTLARGEPGLREWVVEWSQLDRYYDANVSHEEGAQITVQAILREDGQIRFHYGVLTDGLTPGGATCGDASVGISNNDGSFAYGAHFNEGGCMADTEVTFTPQ